MVPDFQEPSKKGGGKRTVGEQEEAVEAQRARENAPHLQAEGEGAEKQQEREQRAAERAQARAAAQAAAGAPPKQGSPAWLDAFFASVRCAPTGGDKASGAGGRSSQRRCRMRQRRRQGRRGWRLWRW